MQEGHHSSETRENTGMNPVMTGLATTRVAVYYRVVELALKEAGSSARGRF